MVDFLGLLYSSSNKNEADCIRQEKDVVSMQPTAAPRSAEGPIQSSYGSVIQILHTDVSLAAQTSQSASPVSKVSEELADAATETKKDVETEATDALAGKAPTELAKAKEETEAQITDPLENEHKEDQPKLMPQDAMVKGPVDELCRAQVDTQNEVAEEGTEKRPVEADENEDPAEMNRKKDDGEVDTEKEELKTPVEVSPAMDTLQTKEPVLNNLTIDEEKGVLTHMDRAENSADTSSAATLVSLSEPSCEVEKTVLAIEKTLAVKVLEKNEEQVVSNLSEMKEEILPPKTQETSEQESSPTMNISEESTVNYMENGQVDDLTGGDWKDENPAEVPVEIPQLTQILKKPCAEPSHIENQELMCELPANSKR